MYVVMRLKDPAWKQPDEVPVGVFSDLASAGTALRDELVRVIRYAEEGKPVPTLPGIQEGVRRKLWEHLVSCHSIYELVVDTIELSGQEKPAVHPHTENTWLPFDLADFE